jgi:phage protein D
MPAEAPIAPARPAVSLGGRESAGLSEGLVSLRVEQDVEGMDRCELEVGNWGPAGDGLGFLYLDRRTLEFGRELSVAVGGERVFSGRITALEARYPAASPPTLVALAEDRFQDLRMTRRTRTFSDLADADVIRRVAGDHSLQADVDLPGPTHRVLAQVDQSDLAFLRERARAADGELWIEGDRLRARTRPGRAGSAVRLGYGNELRDLVLTADLAGQRTSVSVGGWDVSGKRSLDETAGESDLNGELRGGDGGAALLRSAFGERKESVARTASSTSDEARARAEALFRRRARRFVRGLALADPDPRLRAGATVRLEGIGAMFEGEYYVRAARLLFDGFLGLRSEIDVERPALGRAS